jgi:hypothetical protein
VTAVVGRAERELALRALEVLAAGYRLVVSGGEPVAGRAATLVTVLRGDAVAARMWVDVETGLLLRQEVHDAAGNVRRMFAFTEVRPGPPPEPGVKPGAAAPASLVRPAVAQARVAWQAATSDAQRRGWCDGVHCPAELPAGFRLLDVRRGVPGGAPVVQLVYGDGLSSISAFVQEGRLDSERLAGFRPETWGDAEVYVGEGWPLRLTWQGGPRVFTVVSDAATSDLPAVVRAFPHERAEPDGGAFAAVGRGMRSVLEWLQGD